MKHKVQKMNTKKFMQKVANVINQDVLRNIVNVIKLEFFVLLYANAKIAKIVIQMNLSKRIDLFLFFKILFNYFFIIFSKIFQIIII